jgi:hypothetical protein
MISTGIGGINKALSFLTSTLDGGQRSTSCPCREEINLLSLPGINPQFLSCPVHSLVTTLTELTQHPQRCIQYKVKMSLCFTKHCVWSWWGSGSITPHILNLDTESEWSVSSSCCFTLGEKIPGTHWIGGWVTSEAVWIQWRRKKSLASTGNWTRSFTVQPVAYDLHYLSICL